MGQSRDWSDALRPAVGAVAAATIVAGIYMLDPAVFDFGFALDAPRTWPVGAFLIAAGAALAFKVVRPKGIDSGSASVDLLASFTLGSLSHYVYGLIACAIGAQALLLNPPNYWAALLLVPGLFCLLVSFDDNNDEESADDADAEGEEVDDEAAEEAGGKSSLGQTARVGLAVGGFLAAFFFALMAWLGIAVWVYAQLKRIIIDGETATSLAPVFEKAMGVAPSLVLLALGLALFLGAVIFVISAIPWPAGRAKTETAPALSMSPTEDRYVNDSAEAVRAYAKTQGYDRNRWVVDAFGFVSVMGMILLGAVVTIGGGEWLEASAVRVSLPLEVKPFGASWIVGLFAFILGGGLPSLILSRLSPRYAELAGWEVVSPKKDPTALTERLSAALRSRELSAATSIDPGAFLRATIRPVERYSLIAAAAIAGVALVLLYRDVNSSDVLSEDAIETTDYWTGTKTQYGYGDVTKVELRCFLTDKDEPVEAYVLHFKDGRKLDIYTKQHLIEAQFAAYEAIDAKLVALNVPFVPGPHQGLFKGAERGYDPVCVEVVAAEFPEALRPRARQFFHQQEMRAVEEIWPWNDTLGGAQRAAENYEIKTALALYDWAIASGTLDRHLKAAAYFGKADARYEYETEHGKRDEELVAALKDFQTSREIEPTARVYAREGALYIALGAYDEARAAYRKALELDKPKPHWSLIGLARVERIQGHYDAAMKHLDDVLRAWGADNASMPIYIHRADVLYLKRDFAGVADAVTKGLRFQPDYAGAFWKRACALAQLGDFPRAKADIAEAVRLAHVPGRVAAWAKTPSAMAHFADLERDRAAIDAMAAGAADDAERTGLCQESWDGGARLRERSALLTR